jgi:hypothetical protein
LIASGIDPATSDRSQKLNTILLFIFFFIIIMLYE